MKKALGCLVAKIGGFLWTKGCKPEWTGDEKWEELSFISKIGYNMFEYGITRLMGFSTDDLEKMADDHLNKIASTEES